MEYCNIPGDAIDPIEREAVEVNVKIGGEGRGEIFILCKLLKY